MIFRFFVFAFISTAMISCGDEPPQDSAPTLTYIGLSKFEMRQGSTNSDTIFVSLQFTDADGDIGGQNSPNIVFIDNRTDEIYSTFSLPALPESRNGADGEIVARLLNTCCLYPGTNFIECTQVDEIPSTELTLDIFLVDEAGNESNRVTTDVITLLCV